MAAYPPDPPEWEPLISLEHRDGRAAVCRDPDRSLWLAWNLDDFSDTDGWDDEPPGEDEEWDPRWEFGDELSGYEIAGLGTAVDDVVAIGGRLPPGAERVEVLDEWGGHIPATAGSGVWLAATCAPAGDQQTVRFFTANGMPVERPLPPEVDVTALSDVGEPCPACEASDWQLLSVPDEPVVDAAPHTSEEWPPGRRAARCAHCGYLHSLPFTGPMQHLSFLTPESDTEELERKHRELLRDAWREAVEGLGTAPVGLVRNWPGARTIAGWGGRPRSTTAITVDHGEPHRAEGPWISVTTSIEVLADDDLITPEGWVEEHFVTALSDRWRDFSELRDDRTELRERLRRSRVEAYARALPRQQVGIPVDGIHVDFLVLGDDTAWAGYATLDAVALTVVARGFHISDAALESALIAQYLPH